MTKRNETKERQKVLYTWTWVGGGYNQHYAYSRQEAMQYAKSMCSLEVNVSSFKRCNAAQAKSYWRNFPIFD